MTVESAITTRIGSRSKREGTISAIRTGKRCFPWQILPYDIYEVVGEMRCYVGTVKARRGRRAVRQGETLQQAKRVLAEQGAR
jgi:hypothetical protein